MLPARFSSGGAPSRPSERTAPHSPRPVVLFSVFRFLFYFARPPPRTKRLSASAFHFRGPLPFYQRFQPNCRSLRAGMPHGGSVRRCADTPACCTADQRAAVPAFRHASRRISAPPGAPLICAAESAAPIYRNRIAAGYPNFTPKRIIADDKIERIPTTAMIAVKKAGTFLRAATANAASTTPSRIPMIQTIVITDDISDPFLPSCAESLFGQPLSLDSSRRLFEIQLIL